MKKKILITGFEPFNEDATNPSGDWISWMSTRNAKPERMVKGLVLPVTFQTAFEIFKKSYDDFRPDVVILTGLAKNRKELTVERIGINWVDARIPDNNGVTLKFQKINPEGPDGVFTGVDLEKLISLALKSGCVLNVSSSAGEYVCNDLLYKVLCYTLDKSTQTTFIHLPRLEDYTGIFLALETMVHEI